MEQNRKRRVSFLAHSTTEDEPAQSAPAVPSKIRAASVFRVCGEGPSYPIPDLEDEIRPTSTVFDELDQLEDNRRTFRGRYSELWHERGRPDFSFLRCILEGRATRDATHTEADMEKEATPSELAAPDTSAAPTQPIRNQSGGEQEGGSDDSGICGKSQVQI